jgi:hypothetical protein
MGTWGHGMGVSTSNECAPHPNTFSYVPSVFVSAQFCATERPTETHPEKYHLQAHSFDVLTSYMGACQKAPTKEQEQEQLSLPFLPVTFQRRRLLRCWR